MEAGRIAQCSSCTLSAICVWWSERVSNSRDLRCKRKFQTSGHPLVYEVSMKTIKKICLNCAQEFDAKLAEHKRGNAKFCSKRCLGIHTNKNRPQPKPNTTCAYCDEVFYLPPSRKTRNRSKSGLFFCCRGHKDAAQSIGGLAEIQPPHYGKGKGAWDYRRLAFVNFPNCCSICGYSKYMEVLIAHHIDFDRSNNVLENLQLVCPTCHDELHFLSKTGRWRQCSPLVKKR